MGGDSLDIIWVFDNLGSPLALIVKASYKSGNINFITPDSFGQQVAYMNRPKGEVIQAHIHEPISRTVIGTQEVLYIRRGRIRVDFYGADRAYVSSAILEAGDLTLLNTGGHGFELLADTDMIEIKQGPFVENRDKTRFVPSTHEIRLVKNLGNQCE
jgi:hypothetical protein